MRLPSPQRVPLAPVIAFGTAPLLSGFLLGDQKSPLQTSFAQWVQEGIVYAMDRGGLEWRSGFARSDAVAFVFRAPTKAKTNSALVGVLAPSEDRFGRPFPFGVMTQMREATYAVAGAALPVAAERFVAEARGLCALAWTESSGSRLASLAERQAFPDYGECTQAECDLRAWELEKGIVRKAWAVLFPEGGAKEAGRVLHALAETVVPMRGHGAVGTRRVLRVPLGSGGAAATSFWMEVVRALAGWTKAVPAAFWPADRADGDALLCLDDVQPAVFGQLWLSQPTEPLVFDVRAPGHAASDGMDMAEVDRVLDREDATMADLVAALGRTKARP